MFGMIRQNHDLQMRVQHEMPDHSPLMGIEMGR